MNDSDLLQVKLREMSDSNPIYKAIFLGLAFRLRSREETSVDATFISVNNVINIAVQFIKNKHVSADDKEKLCLNSAELRQLIGDLEKSTHLSRKESSELTPSFISKESIEALFLELQCLGVGRYIRGRGRNKARFHWVNGWCNNLGCAALGKCELTMGEDYKFVPLDSNKAPADRNQLTVKTTKNESTEDDFVKVRGAQCIFRFEKGFEENKRDMKQFLNLVKAQIEHELDKYN